MKRKQRELTGVLQITPLGNLGQLHFLRTKEGNCWRLDVAPERVRHLNGLAVQVRGEEAGGVIQVRSIAQA